MKEGELPKKLIIPGEEKLKVPDVKLEVPPNKLILPNQEIIKPEEPDFGKDQKIILPDQP